MFFDVLTNNTKNDLPREGKKLVCLIYLGWKAQFSLEINAILYSFYMGSRFSGLGSFWVSFGVSREPLLEPGGTHLDFSWATWQLLGCLGWLLGSLGEPCGTNLGFSWVTLCPLGSLVTQIWASVGWLCLPWGQIWLLLGIWFANQVFCLIFGCRVCGYWWSRFRYMSMCKYWSPATHKTKCTHVRNLPVTCTCWSIIWHVRLLQQTIENY